MATRFVKLIIKINKNGSLEERTSYKLEVDEAQAKIADEWLSNQNLVPTYFSEEKGTIKGYYISGNSAIFEFQQLPDRWVEIFTNKFGIIKKVV